MKTFILKLVIKNGWEESIILGRKYEKIEVKEELLPLKFAFLKQFVDESIIMYPLTNLFIKGEDDEVYPIESMNYERAYITCDGNTIEKLPIPKFQKDKDWMNYWCEVSDKNPGLFS